MTKLTTQILKVAKANAGYRIDTRWLAKHLNVTADQLNTALDLLGHRIVRVRGVAGYIVVM